MAAVTDCLNSGEDPHPHPRDVDPVTCDGVLVGRCVDWRPGVAAVRIHGAIVAADVADGAVAAGLAAGDS